MTDKFIAKAVLVHGDKYDYSKVEYINAKTKITITCKVHGPFEQLPQNLLRQGGCKECGVINRINSRRSNVEEFIAKAILVHGYTYDYSKYDYKNCKTKSIIICKKHGPFKQNANNHLQGKKCPKCSGVYKPDSAEFIEKAMLIHGEKYNYSKVEYIDSKTKIIITCNDHGDFEQNPANHLQGNGCSKCVDRRELLRYDTEEFIEKSKLVHGDTYDYSTVVYIDSKNKIVITCKVHGPFEQQPSSHLQGAGCLVCSGCYKPNTAEFIEKAILVHEDTYDYSTVEYVNARTKIIINCKVHGPFEQTPDSHLSGCGCNKCADIIRRQKRSYDTNEFIEKSTILHGTKYDYSKVVYIDSITKIIITCNDHGDFEQTPAGHLAGNGCIKCGVMQSAEKKKYTTEEFIEKAIVVHGKKYNYSKVNYIGYKIKVTIICNKHGPFLQNPSEHWDGCGCPLCVNKTESKLYETLKLSYSSLQAQYKQEWCKKITYLPFDFCIPELKIIIELDGEQHFKQVSNWKSPEIQFENDIYKQKCANENGFSIIRLLQEDVFNDSYDWNAELCQAIESIKAIETTNVYLCKNDEYALYKL